MKQAPSGRRSTALRHGRSRALALLLVAAAALGGASGQAWAADPTPEALAKTYYDAGVQAYAAGRFSVAIEAFSEAHRLADKPTLLFSLAQAERREYTVSRDTRTLRSAVAHFRRYLDEVKEGGRRADAVEALGELDAVAARVEAAAGDSASPDKAAPTSRILITTTTKGATVLLDDVEHAETPVVERILPGKHVVRVTAPGYMDEVREVVTVEGAILPLEITLREKPSFLLVRAPVGAAVTIDGRLAGVAPLAGDIEVTAGAHAVSITKSGRVPHQERVVVALGQSVPVHVSLALTTQRVTSFAVLGGGAAALLAGTGLAIAALDAEGTARHVLSLTETSNLRQLDLDRYNDAVARRDGMTRASLGLFGAGALLGIAAGALYLFDDRDPPAARAPSEARRSQVSLSFGPAGPGLGFTGTF
jgi:hypothetical protein